MNFVGHWSLTLLAALFLVVLGFTIRLARRSISKKSKNLKKVE